MSTIEEALAQATVDNTQSAVCTIDVDTRKINIPSVLLPFGVESDEKSKVIHFVMDNQFGLSANDISFYINYKNGNGDINEYLVTDVVVTNSEINFSWELSRHVTEKQGNIYFIVCARRSDLSGEIIFEWNTTLATATVLEGLEAEIIEDEDSYDIIQQLLEYHKKTQLINQRISERYEALINTIDELEPLQREVYGTVLNLQDTVAGRAEITDLVHNLLSYPYLEITKTINGVTFTELGDGRVNIKGTPSAHSALLLTDKKPISELSFPFVISEMKHNDGISIQWYDENKVYISEVIKGIDFKIVLDSDVPNNAVYYNIVLFARKDVRYDDFIFEPMINLGTILHPYVPPMGYEVVSCGKNLYDISKAENIVVNSNGSIIITNNYKTSDFIPIDPQNNYTVSAIKNGSSAWIRFCLYDKNKNFVRRTDTASFPRTVQFSDAYYVRLCYENTANNYFNNVQFEFGAQSSPYEDFQGDSVTITKDTEKAYIKTYDGITNIFCDTDINVEYALSKNGARVLNVVTETATETENGLMSAEDKFTLDNLTVSKEDKLTETKSGSIISVNTIKGRAEITDLIHNDLLYPYTSTSGDKYGITYEINKDGTIYVSGTATATVYIKLKTLDLYGTYSLSGCPIGGSKNAYQIYTEKNNARYGLEDNGYGSTFTFNDEGINFFIFIKIGATVNHTFKPMLVKGTEPKPFVPPIGYDIVSRGRNLYKEIKGLQIDGNNGGEIINPAYNSTDFISINVEPLIYSAIIPDGSYSRINFFDLNKNFINREVLVASSLPYRLDNKVQNAKYVRICNEANVSNEQIEYNVEPTQYEPHVEDKVTVTQGMNKAYINTYDWHTDIISPVDVTAKYAISENGKSVMEDIENSVDGSDILLTDCLDGKCEVSGLVHNELPYPYYDTIVTRQGVTFTDNGDGTITLNGTAINNVYFYFSDNREGYSNKKLVELFAKNDITLKGGTNKVSLYYYNRIKSYTDVGDGRIVPKQAGVTNGHVGLYIVSGSTFDNETIKPMLVKDTESKPFVPPMGYDMLSCGKNLFDKFNTENTSYGTVTQIPNGISVTGIYYVQNVINVKPNTNYSVSYLATKKTDEASVRVCVYSSDLKNEITRNNTGHLIFNSNNYTEIALLFYAGTNMLNTTEYTNIQLELGTEATPYEPYHADIVKVTKDVDKVYLDTYKDYTNIFTEYDVDLHVAYGVTEKANDRFLAKHAVNESKKVYDKVYPIGSLYMNVNQVDPSEMFGGTWEALTEQFAGNYVWKRIS